MRHFTLEDGRCKALKALLARLPAEKITVQSPRGNGPWPLAFFTRFVTAVNARNLALVAIVVTVLLPKSGSYAPLLDAHLTWNALIVIFYSDKGDFDGIEVSCVEGAISGRVVSPRNRLEALTPTGPRSFRSVVLYDV